MDEAEVKTEHQKIIDAVLELHHLFAFAQIFGNEDCWNSVSEFFSQEAEETPLASRALTKHRAEQGGKASIALVTKLIGAARHEFGVES